MQDESYVLFHPFVGADLLRSKWQFNSIGLARKVLRATDVVLLISLQVFRHIYSFFIIYVSFSFIITD